MLARAHKKFQRGQHSEIYLLTLKKQDKTKMELPLDMEVYWSLSAELIPEYYLLSPNYLIHFKFVFGSV